MPENEGSPIKRAPSLRNARSFISQAGVFPESNLHAAGTTTAVSLQTAEQAEILLAEPEHRLNDLAPVASNRPSLASNLSPHFESIVSSDGESFSDESHAGLHLSGVLGGLMPPGSNGGSSGQEAISKYNPLTDDGTAFDDMFLRSKVLPDKLDREFRGKLKQFFILSAAGKPIYSLNGNDDVLLGYMGLLTTIIASFQDGMKQEVRSISSGSLKIVVKNYYPLILVAMSKIPHEISSVASVGETIMENQLDCLYNYILAVLSKSVITKNFASGMNYDLRRILTLQDLHALDTLSMKLTYGLHSEADDEVVINKAFYLSAILGNAMRCVRISNTCRTKLNDIFLSVKKIRKSKESTETHFSTFSRFTASEDETLLASDLLFGFISIDDEIVSHLRPRNHKLQSRDVSTLLFTIQMNSESLVKNSEADLWIPLCMPEFNSRGFLYCYVKNFSLASCDRPLTIILVSGSKNSFFSMKEAANYTIAEIKKKSSFSRRLGSELSLSTDKKSILTDLKIDSIKHFIYRRKEINQIYIDDSLPNTKLSDGENLLDSLQLMTHYSNLINSKGNGDCTTRYKTKKLSYSRLQIDGIVITGFLLTDEKYEFYCLCEGSISSKTIIDESLHVIKWCDRYKRRLFVQEGISF